MAARHEQIGQRASDEQAMEVLVQPPIAHLGKAEHPLDDPDRMLDPGPHFGLGAMFRPLDLVHDAAVAVAAVGLIARHPGLLPMQQIRQHRAIGGIGRRVYCRVDQPGAAVDADMRLHDEVPLVALPGLMHLGIGRLLGVLAR